MSTTDISTGVRAWCDEFERALSSRDADGLRSLFAERSYLRDNGALTWDFRQFHGRDAVVSTLLDVVDEIRPTGFRVSDSWPQPHLLGDGEGATIEAFFDFDTVAGTAVALINGTPDDSSPYGLEVHAMYTRLETLNSVSEPERHPRGSGFTPAHAGQTYAEHVRRRREWVDGDPDVLIVGAGQAGLVAAAHLAQLGVSALIVDKNERVGDNWRKRYDSLSLHNPVEMNGFPFLDFPPHYPEYLPKDVIGGWLETYARYLDLNVWTSTDFVGAERDESSGSWTVTLRTADGSERVLHPRHIVLATGGIGGKPSIPALPGLTAFSGPVLHSASYTKASDYAARKAIIVGTATSAHDIALDLYENGTEVTMVQRNPVVVNHVATANLAYAGYIDPTIPTELVDIRYGIGLINPLRESASQQYHAFAKDLDADLLKGLEAAGLRLGDGVNGQGWLDLFLRTGGGYYLNKGASEVIVAGGIKVLPYDRIVEFVGDGAKLDDGSVLEADIVILATGYLNRKVEVADQFGEEIADRVGEIARLDSEGEWSTMWGQSGQPGLWINGGGINQIRPGSKLLALLIKADLDGSIPAGFRRPPKNAQARHPHETASIGQS
ncbi:NAD(P)-binding domain-containing protein [Microbacterium sp. 22303]|uniref:NAD(P)-binding domain-containing protein n=1 Tax=Microbacterium sp. 22303 TaxID=3453905 RepID=UPI003F8674EA